MVGTDAVNNNGTEERLPPVRYGQAFRPRLVEMVLAEGKGEVARKTARILAISIPEDFIVETDRGDMEGKPGDWLVTNHPDDDPGADVWSISDERFQATYELVPVEPDRSGRIREGVSRETLGSVAGEAVPYTDASPEATEDREL